MWYFWTGWRWRLIMTYLNTLLWLCWKSRGVRIWNVLICYRYRYLYRDWATGIPVPNSWYRCSFNYMYQEYVTVVTKSNSLLATWTRSWVKIKNMRAPAASANVRVGTCKYFCNLDAGNTHRDSINMAAAAQHVVLHATHAAASTRIIRTVGSTVTCLPAWLALCAHHTATTNNV